MTMRALCFLFMVCLSGLSPVLAQFPSASPQSADEAPVPPGQYKMTNMDTGRSRYIKVTPGGQMLDGNGQAIQPTVWKSPGPPQQPYYGYGSSQSRFFQNQAPQSAYRARPAYPAYSGYTAGYPQQAQYRNIPGYGANPSYGYSSQGQFYQPGQQPYQTASAATTTTGDTQSQPKGKSKLSVLGGILKGALGTYMRYKYGGYGYY